MCVFACVYIYEQTLCSVIKHHTVEKYVARIVRLLYPPGKRPSNLFTRLKKKMVTWFTNILTASCSTNYEFSAIISAVKGKCVLLPYLKIVCVCARARARACVSVCVCV